MDLLDTPINHLMSTRLSSLEDPNTLAYAILQMIQNRFSRLPVVQGEQLVGILTASDILRIIDKANSIDVLQDPVSSHMIKDVVTVNEDQSFGELLETMATQDVSCVPVTNNGKLIGIYTNKDLLFFNTFWQELPEITITADLEGLHDFVPTLIVPENSPISTIIHTMTSHKVNHVILRDDNELIGTISKDRVMRSIASSLIVKGFDMEYLDQKVLDRVVSDSIFDLPLGQSLHSYRNIFNTRGVDSLFLTENEGSHEINYILDEEAMKNIIWSTVSSE